MRSLLVVAALAASSPVLAQGRPVPDYPSAVEGPVDGPVDDDLVPPPPPPEAATGRWDARADDRDYRDGREEREERALARTADRLQDPATTRAITQAIGAMTDAILDVRIDRLRAAADDFDRGMRGDRYRTRDRWDDRSERTIGDVIARDDPGFRARMRRDAEVAARGAGAAARTAADMAPELRRIADEFGRRVEEAIERAARD